MSIARQVRLLLASTFDESKHPRGQPENQGEFVRKGHIKWIKESDYNDHNISREVRNHISDILNHLSNSYPAVARFVKGLTFTKSVTNEFDAFTRTMRVSSAQLSGSVEELDDFHDRANKSGFMVGGGVEALLVHEFAHGIDHCIIAQADEDVKDEWFATKKRLEKSIGPASEYAKKSTREWFAEQFTAEYTGRKPKQLIPVIEYFLAKEH